MSFQPIVTKTKNGVSVSVPNPPGCTDGTWTLTNLSATPAVVVASGNFPPLPIVIDNLANAHYEIQLVCEDSGEPGVAQFSIP